ncbi:hypothetical protein, partial [Actinoalloteichus caeruleus]|uniref:hypothetical protein n=1 Tax=Actinoalloteichus cyanogriseus TaxID=2893586 RepID=UPI001B80146C
SGARAGADDVPAGDDVGPTAVPDPRRHGAWTGWGPGAVGRGRAWSRYPGERDEVGRRAVRGEGDGTAPERDGEHGNGTSEDRRGWASAGRHGRGGANPPQRR